MILNYLGGLCLITRGPQKWKREAEEEVGVMRNQNGSDHHYWSEDGGGGQRMQAARSWKRQGNDSSLELPERKAGQ